MASTKHSKYKNTGLLFELLVRQITVDMLNGNNSPAVNILKKYFVNTELGKEYKIYEQLTQYSNLTETRSEIVINSLLVSATKLNKTLIKKQRYSLIREIKNNYNLDTFFKTRIPNYKIFAALNNLIEYQNTEAVNPSLTITNKITLLEFLTKEKTPEVEDTLLEEYKQFPKDIKILTHRIMLEKFNEKYDHLLSEQKEVLRQVINSIDNTDTLKEYYNKRIIEVRKTLKSKLEKPIEPVIRVKIEEVLKYILPRTKTQKVTNNCIVNLMQYYQLINELDQ